MICSGPAVRRARERRGWVQASDGAIIPLRWAPPPRSSVPWRRRARGLHPRSRSKAVRSRVGQLDLDDLGDTRAAQLDRHAHEQPVDAVLALQVAAQGRISLRSLRIESTICATDAAGA